MNDHDADAAAFRLSREPALQYRLVQSAKALGDMIGVTLLARHVTPEFRDTLVEKFCEGITQLGNHALAEQYRTAWNALHARNRELDASFHRLDAQDVVTDKDIATFHATRRNLYDADEWFSRVAAEAAAWLDRVKCETAN